MELDYRVGDVLDELRKMPSESVHCIVTSPPYYGLRDYKNPPVVWGGDPNCLHDSIMVKKESELRTGLGLEKLGERYRGGGKKQGKLGTITSETGFCRKCSAWQGNLGLEPTPELYVQHLVMIFEECKRVLRKDGTFWLNIADSYAGSGKGQMGDGHHAAKHRDKQHTNRGTLTGGLPTDLGNFKPKDLMMIPARVAIALQANGWYVRSEIIWAKGISFCESYAGAVMPESVQDRPCKSHETIFLLTKSEKYFYDIDAVREPLSFNRWSMSNKAGSSGKDVKGKEGPPGQSPSAFQRKGHSGYFDSEGKPMVNLAGRNLRSVWVINPASFPGKHFAVFPIKLVEPCAKAGTSPICCGICGAPWVRIIERQNKSNWEFRKAKGAIGGSMDFGNKQQIGSGWSHDLPGRDNKTIGWKPTCKHNDNTGKAVVLDPFAGRGTTLLVADNLGRKGIGIDINESYKELAIAYITSEKAKLEKKSKKSRSKSKIESEIIPTPYFPAKQNGKALEDFKSLGESE